MTHRHSSHNPTCPSAAAAICESIADVTFPIKVMVITTDALSDVGLRQIQRVAVFGVDAARLARGDHGAARSSRSIGARDQRTGVCSESGVGRSRSTSGDHGQNRSRGLSTTMHEQAFAAGVLQHFTRGLPRLLVTAVIEFWRSSPVLITLFVMYYSLPSFGINLSGITVAARWRCGAAGNIAQVGQHGDGPRGCVSFGCGRRRRMGDTRGGRPPTAMWPRSQPSAGCAQWRTRSSDGLRGPPMGL
ncbi:ABC transporter permease [Paracoccus mutanolyticus]|uniref:hypothetical protein n=1 Tax=Paracoccus mutanolyticus TaxID=1499308 RepID=UPI001CB96B13|nr:hypothetical protein [Paracoccus mutanolyticus]